jgi:hypothetical protein
MATTEKWNGSSWATTSTLNVARQDVAGCGTISDALSFGGYSSTYSATTERWSQLGNQLGFIAKINP